MKKNVYGCYISQFLKNYRIASQLILRENSIAQQLFSLSHRIAVHFALIWSASQLSSRHNYLVLEGRVMKDGVFHAFFFSMYKVIMNPPPNQLPNYLMNNPPPNPRPVKSFHFSLQLNIIKVDYLKVNNKSYCILYPVKVNCSLPLLP